MTKIKKKVWVVFALLLLTALFFCWGGGTPEASGISNYIKNTIIFKEDGKVYQSLILSTEFPNSFSVLDKEAFKTQLRANLDLDLEEKKQEIIDKYSQENKEEYNPIEKIVFGDNGQAVKGKDFVGYSIEYSSIEVFKYYNKIQTSYQKGFLMDKSSILLDNPFNDTVDLNGVVSTEADKYIQIFKHSGQVVGMENYVNTQYNPVFYNDYVTLSRRTKSKAYSVVKDDEGFYHHMWISDLQDLTSDEEMNLTLNVIHSGWWYLLGTAIPLAIMFIAIILVVISRKIKKYKNKQKLN